MNFFKNYNDHLAGDEVLREAANKLARHRRSGDTAYRYGGEEFLIVLPEQDLVAASTIAERLRRAVENLKMPHEAKDPPWVVTISAGVATVSAENPGSADELLEEADDALYRAKEAGRNRWAAAGAGGEPG